VHLLNLEDVLSFGFNDIIVQFIPARDSCKLRSWKFRKRRKEEAIEAQTQKVECSSAKHGGGCTYACVFGHIGLDLSEERLNLSTEGLHWRRICGNLYKEEVGQ
jgi:hypothetical protein